MLFGKLFAGGIGHKNFKQSNATFGCKIYYFFFQCMSIKINAKISKTQSNGIF